MRPTTSDSGGTKLPGWLRPPDLADPDEARIAATVHLLSLSIIAAALAWTITSFVVLWRPWTVFPISVTVGVCLIAETRFSYAGLGYMVIDSFNRSRFPEVYAVLVVIVGLAVAANALVMRIGAGRGHEAIATGR